jgi:hypothetical protein
MGNTQQLLCSQAPNNVIRHTTMEMLDVTTQYATNEEVVGPLLVPCSREAVPGSSQVAPSSIAVQGAKKDAKDGKKKRKRHPQWVATMPGYDNDNDKKAVTPRVMKTLIFFIRPQIDD